VLKTCVLLILMLGVVSACATVPTGPSVMVGEADLCAGPCIPRPWPSWLTGNAGDPVEQFVEQ
jgi:hypothetical protein